jgi:hypothetical protein
MLKVERWYMLKALVVLTEGGFRVNFSFTFTVLQGSAGVSGELDVVDTMYELEE